MKPHKERSATSVRKVDSGLLRRWPLPSLDGELGKEARGTLLVVGGSRELAGAAMLAAIAGLRAGAGSLQIATVRSAASHLSVAVPEAKVVSLPESRRGEIATSGCRALYRASAECQAVVIGPGMSEPAAGVALVKHCIENTLAVTLVVDAAPLCEMGFLERHKKSVHSAVILTPHAGEMARLWNTSRDHVLARPLEIALETAKRLDAVVLLKGPTTWITAPDGTAFKDTSGNLGLGTSGSGDVLAGVIGGLAARGASPIQAAVWGVHLHGLSGEVLATKVGPLGYLAREILDEIPKLLIP